MWLRAQRIWSGGKRATVRAGPGRIGFPVLVAQFRVADSRRREGSLAGWLVVGVGGACCECLLRQSRPDVACARFAGIAETSRALSDRLLVLGARTLSCRMARRAQTCGRGVGGQFVRATRCFQRDT